ncbi:unnamed protein product [Aphanomyces euteiches]
MEPEFGLYEQRKIISKKKTALAADEHTATDEHGIAIEAEDPKPDEIFDPNDAIYLMDAPDLEDDDHNESMDSTEKTRPGKRDPVKDPDVSPQSQIPLKVQAVESPPIPLKLDGSTPPNNLDEEELDEILNEPDQEYDPNEGIGYLGESAPADHLEVASRGLAMRGPEPSEDIVPSRLRMNQLGSGRIEPSGSEIQLVRDIEQFFQRVTQNVLVIANQDYNNFMLRQQVEQATQFANMRPIGLYN